MILVKCFIISLSIAAQLASAAAAGVIVSYTVTFHPHSSQHESFPWMTNLWFSYNYFPFQDTAVLFNGQDTFDTVPSSEPGIDILSNIGNTFWAASDQDDPDYSHVVSMLTGQERVYGWIHSNICCAYPISWSTINMEERNLYGYTIERIGLRIDSAEVNFDSQSRYYIYSTTLTAIVEGHPTVPEPPSVLILISGIALLFGFRRRWRK